VTTTHFFCSKFEMQSYTFLDSNISSSPAYGVYTSQLIRYSRTCNSYRDLLHRSVLLTRKLLSQGFIKTLKCFLVVTIIWYSLIVSQWPPSLMISVIHDIVVMSTFHYLIRHRDIMTGTAWGARNAYPSGAPDFPSCFHRGSCCPVICVSLFHVVVLSFAFCVLIVPFVWLLGIYIFYFHFYWSSALILYWFSLYSKHIS